MDLITYALCKNSSASAAGAAASSASAAQAAQNAAETAQGLAEDAQEAAETARNAAQSAQSAAESAKSGAEAAKSGAETAKTAAETAAGNASDDADAAASSASAAAQSAQAAQEAAQTALGIIDDEAVAADSTWSSDKISDEIEAISPDDESVGAKPWSSKQIIDALCPPLEESGNPVQCYPVAGYPLGVKAAWEPRQEGEGDPSPDNVRPITGLDSVQVTQCGKNLLDVGEITGVVWANKSNDPYILEILNTFNNLPAGEYRFAADLRIDSVEDTVSSTSSLLYGIIVRNSQNTIDSIAINRNYLGIGNVPSVGDILRVDEKVLIKPEYAGTYDEIYLYSAGSDRLTDRTSGTMYNFQLELGSASTAYAPYTGTTATLNLPETIYGGTVDAVTGAGSKTWGYIASYNGESLPGEWISDRDVYSAGTTPTTGAQVAYKLITPEPFQATGSQHLPALSGENVLITNADSLTVTGRTDPTHTIQTLSDRIAALESETIEGGTNA